MQSKWQKFKKYYPMVAGYLFVWIVLGNLLGYVLSEHLYYVFYPDELLIEDISDQHYLRHEKCYPVSSYGYEAKCENQFLQWFWIILVSIPSFTIFCISFNVALFHTKTIFDGLYFGIAVIPFVVIVIIPAIYYWLKTNKKIACFVAFIFFYWIIWFNLTGRYK
jgi:hypothetical protein